MADKTISQLTGATTPLAGTEVLPLVQSSATKKVAVDDLTVKNIRSNSTSGLLQLTGPAAAATRVMTTPDANFIVARTDTGQTFTGLQSFTNAGSENIKFTDGTKSATIQQADAQTYFNGNISLAAPAIFNWRHTSAYTQLMQLTGSTGNLTLSTGNFVIGTAGKGLAFPGSVLWQTGTGTPEGAVTAPVGSLYTNTSGGAGTTLYVKESGAGNTGWVAK